MIGIAFGQAQRAPAHAAAGIEDERRLGFQASRAASAAAEGLAVVVEHRLAEGVGQMATTSAARSSCGPFWALLMKRELPSIG
jgi:hypothetical protein